MMEENSSGRFSVTLSNVLDVMGYSYTHIKGGQKFSEITQNLINHKRDKVAKTFIAGSKKEGLSFQEVGGDIDYMIIYNRMRCFQMSDSALRSQEDRITYLLQYEGCPPGYTMLEVDEHSNDNENAIFHIRSAKTSKQYLSSEMISGADLAVHSAIKKRETDHRGPLPTKSFTPQLKHYPDIIRQHSRGTPQRSELKQIEFESVSRNGPSLTMEYKFPFFTYKSKDNVIALPALCPDYMYQWTTRHRNHNFPTVEQIERISKMDAHVVPVGCKGTPDADLQWRICFTLGEVELVKSLNGTQLKLYALLKMLAKNVIKPECPGIITSYVMKNVVLWMAELKPHDHFREENLENCIIEAVHYLRLCVRKGFLPNYMIHSRNLLQGRLSLQDRGILLKLLGTLVQEKGNMVMRCEKVRHNLNCPYISRLFKYAGKDTQICVDIFRKFLKPALLHELTDMEDVFSAFLLSVDRRIDKQTIAVKLQVMVLLKYIKTWITGQPYKSPERIEKRSQMRRKCGDLRQCIAMSVANDFAGNPNFNSLIKSIIPLIADVRNLPNEELDYAVNSDNFIELLAEEMLTFIHDIGNLNIMGVLNSLSHHTQTAKTTPEAQQTEEKHAQQQRLYSDLDLD